MLENLILLIIIVGIALYIIELFKIKDIVSTKPNFTKYEKRAYILDTNSEFKLYKIILELFGDKYIILPQINYSHLIQPKKSTWVEERKLRNRIDRKSADFVICDKERIIPLLVIELDGSAHNFKSKIARDKFIDEIAKVVGLPILHINTNNLNSEYIKEQIEFKLR